MKSSKYFSSLAFNVGTALFVHIQNIIIIDQKCNFTNFIYERNLISLILSVASNLHTFIVTEMTLRLYFKRF